MFTSDVIKARNVHAQLLVYHKFSHRAAFYTLNGKNINVMLELGIILARLDKVQEELLYYSIRLGVSGVVGVCKMLKILR